MEDLRQTSVSLPELVLMASTRVILGAGLALLLADRLTSEQRKATGWSLFGLGMFLTIPISFQIWGEGRIFQEVEPGRRERRLAA